MVQQSERDLMLAGYLGNLAERIASQAEGEASKWMSGFEVGLVVGARHPDVGDRVLRLIEEVWSQITGRPGEVYERVRLESAHALAQTVRDIDAGKVG